LGHFSMMPTPAARWVGPMVLTRLLAASTGFQTAGCGRSQRDCACSGLPA
jgi:hypothetical protein